MEELTISRKNAIAWEKSSRTWKYHEGNNYSNTSDILRFYRSLYKKLYKCPVLDGGFKLVVNRYPLLVILAEIDRRQHATTL